MRKLARPFHGPYRIAELTTNDAYIRRVDRPSEEPILVSLERLRRCPDEIPDCFWPGGSPKKRDDPKKRGCPKDLSPVLETNTDDKGVHPESQDSPSTVVRDHAEPGGGQNGSSNWGTEMSCVISPSAPETVQQTTTNKDGGGSSKWAGRLCHRGRR